MTLSLIETDKALEQLLVELTSLKSSAQQLQNAEQTAGQAIKSAESVTQLAAKVLDTGNRQLEAVNDLVAHIETHVVPQIESTRRIASLNRWLLIFVAILVLGNGALTYWVYQLLLNR